MRIKVNENILNSAVQFFKADLITILHELLQNARRAQANTAWISISQIENSNLIKVTVKDNGIGIFKQGIDLELGGSHWCKEIIEQENPAGCGLFSLAQVGCTIENNGYLVELDTKAFRGQREIPIQKSNSTDKNFTIISFQINNENYQDYPHLAYKLQWYNLDIYLQEKLIKTKRNFIDDCDYIKSFDDYEIGFINNKTRGVQYNYFGLAPIYANDLLSFKSLKVLINFKTGKIRLTLPQRDSLLQDQAYYQLKEDLEATYYQYLDTLEQLPVHMTDFEEEYAFNKYGIDLSKKRTFLVTTSNGTQETKTLKELEKAILISADNYSLTQELDLVQILNKSSIWIPACDSKHLPSLELADLEVLRNNEWVSIQSIQSTVVDGFRAKLIKDNIVVYKSLEIPYLVHFVEEYPSCLFEGLDLFRLASIPTTALDIREMAIQITDASFIASEEGDSYTEKEDYQSEVEEMLTGLIFGSDAQRHKEIYNALESTLFYIKQRLLECEEIRIDKQGIIIQIQSD